jgi:nucleoside 2-deoxyribosyltransferase
MPRRFYVSSRKDRSEQANALSEVLKARGWERTFVWSDQPGAGLEARAATAEAELKGVRDADILVVLLPGGFGTHVEIGAALALGKKVLLHSPDRKTLETPYPCVFHYHPGVKLVVSGTLDVSQVVAVMEDHL